MNKTKKLTQGAMMLAILGALILIDRMTAYWFTEFVVLIAPIIIIMYSAMQTFKDGAMLSVGVLIISFLLGNFQMVYLIYIPVGIVTGLIYSYFLQKGFDKGTLLFIACASYVVGEIIAMFIVYPLFGFPISQMIEEYKLALNQSSSMTGFDFNSLLSGTGLDTNKIIIIIYFISTIITGAMEGFLIHLLCLFLLKRFKIKDLGRINLWDIKPNKVLAYISFLSLFALFFRNKIPNETVQYIIFALSIIGVCILMYYGYLFICLYGAMVLKRNIGGLYVILCLFIPVLLIALVIMGFLYATGPLRDYLEKKVEQIRHE